MSKLTNDCCYYIFLLKKGYPLQHLYSEFPSKRSIPATSFPHQIPLSSMHFFSFVVLIIDKIPTSLSLQAMAEITERGSLSETGSTVHFVFIVFLTLSKSKLVICTNIERGLYSQLKKQALNKIWPLDNVFIFLESMKHVIHSIYYRIATWDVFCVVT